MTQFLFHGSKVLAKDIYNSEEGIDMRFSNENSLWGRGTYFSTTAFYSNSYNCQI